MPEKQSGAPGGAPKITIDGVELVKPTPTAMRLLGFVADSVAGAVGKLLPPGVVCAVILTDTGPEGFWSARTVGQGNHLNSAASWLTSNGVPVGGAAEPPPAPDQAREPEKDAPPDPTGTAE